MCVCARTCTEVSVITKLQTNLTINVCTKKNFYTFRTTENFTLLGIAVGI